MLKLIKNKRGSSVIMLGMAFVTFAICIAGAINISRNLTVKSECESFGRVWTRAILSEFDRHLLEDYQLMAYWGLDSDVQKRLKNYVEYTFRGKLNQKTPSVSVNLNGTELGNPENLRQAMRNAGISSAITKVKNKSKRGRIVDRKDDKWGKRVIRNKVVIDNLPSKGIKNTFDIESIKNGIGSRTSAEGLVKTKASGRELAFMYMYLGTHNTRAGEKATLFRNEWEYVIAGTLDDDKNYRISKRNIFLLRNALNLAYLYKDPAKNELIISTAELLTPGPAAVATDLLIRETWAALESKKDVEFLRDGKRVPLMKTAESWNTDITSALKSSGVKDKLDEEARRNLNRNIGDISDDRAGKGSDGSLAEGLNYEEYLMIFLAAMNENVRLLRIMDIVSINMRFRYYEDFNMDEYHTGVRFTIKANGRDYLFEDEYK